MAPRNKIAAAPSLRLAVLRPNGPSPGLAQETAGRKVERALPSAPALSCAWLRQLAAELALMDRLR